jgi:hypothetical protein
MMSNWKGAPCPTCGDALAQRGTEETVSSQLLTAILVCERGHCWEEHIDPRTLFSDVFVRRRADLETSGDGDGDGAASADEGSRGFEDSPEPADSP